MRYRSIAVVGAVLLMFIAGSAYAAERKGDPNATPAVKSRIVKGFITQSYGDNIVVNSETFTITGVPIDNAYGKKMSSADLKKNAKVKLIILGTAVKKVTITQEAVKQ